MNRDYLVPLPHGNLAIRCWGAPTYWERQQNPQVASKPRQQKKTFTIIALHGFMDNLASFDKLAYALVQRNTETSLIAVDFPNHGHSDHLQEKSGLIVLSYSFIIQQLIFKLNIEKVLILGHSLGATVSLFIANAIPKHIIGIMAIEGLIAKYIQEEKLYYASKLFYEKLLKKELKKQKPYKNKEVFIRSKARAIGVSTETIRPIVERNLKKIADGYIWRRDFQLEMPLSSPFYWSPTQLRSFLLVRLPPILAILAKGDTGKTVYTKFRKAIYDELKNTKNIENQIDIRKFPALGHHFHLEYADPLSSVLSEWMELNLATDNSPELY